VDNLRFVLAGAAAAICGLLAYGIAPSNGILWAAVAAVVAFGGVIAASNLSFRADDRDPTIRPTNVTRGDKRNRS
jgi:hypothetical protein